MVQASAIRVGCPRFSANADWLKFALAILEAQYLGGVSVDARFSYLSQERRLHFRHRRAKLGAVAGQFEGSSRAEHISDADREGRSAEPSASAPGHKAQGRSCARGGGHSRHHREGKSRPVLCHGLVGRYRGQKHTWLERPHPVQADFSCPAQAADNALLLKQLTISRARNERL